jgi:hypothetical protein
MIEHMTETAFAPPPAVSAGPLGVVQSANREIARLTAVRARALADFAASRPASVDRQQGERGAMSPQRWAARPEVLRPVSEWATQELQVALAYTEGSAQALLERSLRLVSRLPGTLAALEAGALHAGHLWPLLDLVADIPDDRTRAEVEGEVLGWVARRAGNAQITTPPQLRDKARRVVARRCAWDAAQQLARAVKRRGVHLRTEGPDGMASVTALLTGPEAQALYAALGAYADAVEDAPGIEPPTRAQKMADALMDLVLRPGEGSHPPVQISLTLVAALSTVLGGDAPGELDGQVIPAEMVRQLLRLLTDATPGGTQPPAGQPPAAEPAAAEPAAEAPAAGEPVASGYVAHDLSGRWDDPDPEHDAAVWAAVEVALHEAEDRWWADFERGLILDPDPPEERPAGGTSTTGARENGAPPGSGWWAAADRAVDDASEAARRARQALGHAQRMVGTAEGADAADESAWQTGPAGRVDAAHDALQALAAAADTDRRTLGALLSRTSGGGLADRPRVALVDALTGALVSLTDLPELRRTGHCGAPACRRAPQACTHDLTGRPGLGAPGPTDGYRPSAALDRFLRARDRRCRFPGCRRPVATGELDHRVRHPDGPTSVTNLIGFCVADHRGKHQAPDWAYAMTPDGSLVVTTPTGLTATTAPPPF